MRESAVRQRRVGWAPRERRRCGGQVGRAALLVFALVSGCGGASPANGPDVESPDVSADVQPSEDAGCATQVAAVPSLRLVEGDGEVTLEEVTTNDVSDLRFGAERTWTLRLANGAVPPGDSAACCAPLRVETLGWELAPEETPVEAYLGPGYVLDAPDLPWTIACGDAAEFTVRYRKDTLRTREAVLTIASPGAEPEWLRVTLRVEPGAAPSGSVVVEPGELDFGSVPPGETRELPFCLHLEGSSARAVTFAALADATREVFAFDVGDGLADNAAGDMLAADGVLCGTVTYSPPVEPDTRRDRWDSATLAVGVESEDGVVHLPVRGLGTYFCPSVSLDSLTIFPPDRDCMVIVSYSEFESPAGEAPHRWEWAFVSTPYDCVPEVPGGWTAPTFAFFRCAPGKYEIMVHVWDESGRRTCEPGFRLFYLPADPCERPGDE